MTEKDQPPEAIWLDDEALHLHFQRVKESYSSSSSGMEQIEDGELEQNETTRRLRRG